MEDECGFEEVLAHVLFGFRKACVGDVGGAVAVQGFYNGGEGAEGCEDSAGVDR